MAEACSRQRWAHTSSMLAMLANMHRGKPKFKPSDFNPHLQRSSSTLPKVEIAVLKQVFIDNRAKGS